jgi:hypothetical protein
MLGHLTYGGSGMILGAHAVQWYATSGGVMVAADVTGDHLPDFMVKLAGVTSLSGSDFLLG